jgi:hypothetical protein
VVYSEFLALENSCPDENIGIISTPLIGCGLWLCSFLERQQRPKLRPSFLLRPKGRSILSLSSSSYGRQPHHLHRLLALFCIPKITAQLPGNCTMSGQSHPCSKPDLPRGCEPFSLESGTMAKWDGILDDSSEQGSTFHGTSSATGSSSSFL